MTLERRTFLKGILGAAAAAFVPLKPEELISKTDVTDRILRCVEDGSYVVGASVELVASGEGHRHYETRFIHNNRECLFGQSILSPEYSIGHMNILQTLSCKAGDFIGLKVLENGIVRDDLIKSAWFDIFPQKGKPW